MIHYYRRKDSPVVRAVQYLGNNLDEIKYFVPYHIVELMDGTIIIHIDDDDQHVKIGDYIVEDGNWEMHICTQEKFDKAYEKM